MRYLTSMGLGYSLCPLCEYRGGSKLIEKIFVSDLGFLYKTLLGIEFKLLVLGRFPESIRLLRCKRCLLKYFYPTIRGASLLFKNLEKQTWYYLDQKEEFDQALENINPSDKVLEIGAGRGEFASKINKYLYTGLEVSASAIKLASARKVRLLKQKIGKHAQRNRERYDVVCAFQVLEHLPNPGEFLTCSLRCLKPGGKLILSVPNDDSFVGVAINHQLNFPPLHLTRWSKEVFAFVARKFNLKIDKVYYEKLREIHVQWYLEVLFSNTINAYLGRRFKLIDTTFAFKIIYGVSIILAKLFSRGIYLSNMRPIGHSLTLVMVKKP